jgi:hypothetical protein
MPYERNVRERSELRAAPAPERPRDRFLHARPWQFGGRKHGRKFRVVCERMRRLARVLARIDKSGDCRAIWASVEAITAGLGHAEMNYPEHQRLTWSRATVFRYLGRLRSCGIEAPAGLSAYHGTRRRSLDPNRLLFVQCESETPTHGESETRSKTLDSKKVQKRKRKQNHPAQKARDDPAFSPASIPAPEGRRTPYGQRVARLKAVARKNILARTSETPMAVDHVLRAVSERAEKAGTIIHSPAYFESGFYAQLKQDAAAFDPDFRPDLGRYLRDARHNVACLQWAVEEAHRVGVPAGRLLAEKLGETRAQQP